MSLTEELTSPAWMRPCVWFTSSAAMFAAFSPLFIYTVNTHTHTYTVWSLKLKPLLCTVGVWAGGFWVYSAERTDKRQQIFNDSLNQAITKKTKKDKTKAWNVIKLLTWYDSRNIYACNFLEANVSCNVYYKKKNIYRCVFKVLESTLKYNMVLP